MIHSGDEFVSHCHIQPVEKRRVATEIYTGRKYGVRREEPRGVLWRKKHLKDGWKNSTKEMERSIQRYQRRKKPKIPWTQHLARWTRIGTFQNPEKITNSILLFLNAMHWSVWRLLSAVCESLFSFSSLSSPQDPLASSTPLLFLQGAWLWSRHMRFWN